MLLFYLSALETQEERDIMSEVYEKHRHAMVRFALSITKNNESAEDAVHNAFVSFIVNKEKYFSLSCRETRALLVVITKSKCIDLLRERKAFADGPIDDMDSFTASDDAPVEEQVILSESYESLKRHMSEIDDASRLVLEMRYYLEMSYKEIGAALGMTPKHVDTKIMRAKEKVRALARKGGRRYGSQKH